MGLPPNAKSTDDRAWKNAPTRPPDPINDSQSLFGDPDRGKTLSPPPSRAVDPTRFSSLNCPCWLSLLGHFVRQTNETSAAPVAVGGLAIVEIRPLGGYTSRFSRFARGPRS